MVKLAKSYPRISKEKSSRVSRAVTGLLSAALPAEAMAGVVTSEKKKGDRGRGRPHGTYKARFVPGKGVVRVPTHIYRRMMTEAKAKRRLAEAQRQAQLQQRYEVEQLAVQTDPRYSSAQTDEQFLEEPDMAHEAQVAGIRERQLYQQQLEQQQQRQPSQFAQRLKYGVGNLINQYRQKNYEMQQRIQQRQIERGDVQQPNLLTPQGPQQAGQQLGQQVRPQQIGSVRPASSQVRIISDRSSILNVPNIFNRHRGYQNKW